MVSGECGGRASFYLEPDEMTKQCGSDHTIATGQLVTNLAEGSLPSACKSSSEVLQSNLSDLFGMAENPNVTLKMIISKLQSILKDIDGVVEVNISKVCELLIWCPI